MVIITLPTVSSLRSISSSAGYAAERSDGQKAMLRVGTDECADDKSGGQDAEATGGTHLFSVP